MAHGFAFCSAAATGCRHCLLSARQKSLALRSAARKAAPAAAAKGARGACDCSPRPPWNSRTLSNAVLWVRSEVDTFLSGQFLVVVRKRGTPN